MTDKSCIGCEYEDSVKEMYDIFCEDCSRAKDTSCSCHIHPPCSVCVNDLYTPMEEKI